MTSNNEEPEKEADEEIGGGHKGVAILDDEQTLAVKRTKPFVVMIAVSAALGGIIFGYDIAGAGATFLMDGFQYQFGWKCHASDSACIPASQRDINVQQGLINGIFGAGAMLGALLSPWIADKYGRRKCLVAASFSPIIGATLQMSAPVIAVLLTGRFFSGIGVGALSMCSPMYISEVAPGHARGRLSTLWDLAITTGILIASAANLGLAKWSQGWRLSYGGNIVFSITLLLCLIFMPESPRWLVAKGYDEDASCSLSMTRYEDEVEDELEDIIRECKEHKETGVASWKDIWAMENNMRYRLLLGVGLQAGQQLSGINAIMFYFPIILNKFLGTRRAIIGTFVLNFIKFFSTFITMGVVERFGRVKLLVSGGLVMMLALVANAVFSSIEQTPIIGYLVLFFAGVYVIAYAYSWGPIVWTVCSEMFPLRYRGKATGITTLSNWTCTVLIGAVFPIASNANLGACFGFLAFSIFAGTVMVYLFLVETAKKSILEIDKEFSAHTPKLVRTTW